MANPEHLAKLRDGVEAWNAWREENREVPADLMQVNLVQAGLRGADFQKTNLHGAVLVQANLRGANLRGANLVQAWLRVAHLQDANLQGAQLTQADLLRADLQDASLQGARLQGANLRGANLRGANLQDADLQGANLRGANLQGADLRGALLGDSVIDSIGLVHVLGLAEVKFSGPATIGASCIESTARALAAEPSRQGEIELFFRKVGLAEHGIGYFRSLIGKPIDFYSCFISYSHADKLFARRLFDRLQGNGIRCWLDEKALVPGQDIHDEIDRGIRIWDKVLLCCSFQSLSSWWVRKELDTAFDKEQQLERETGKKALVIIPLMLDDAIESWADGRAVAVKQRVWADFTDWENNDAFEAGFEKVKLALKAGEVAGGQP